MIFNQFKSPPPETPYAPFWDFTVGSSFCGDINLNSLVQTILEKEEEIKSIPVIKDEYGDFIDGYTGLGEDSTTVRFGFYNVLSWNTLETNQLKDYILNNLVIYNEHCGNDTPDEVWAQCWVNILSYGEHIQPHFHSIGPDTYLSGHFNVQTENTSTVYMSPINQLNDPEVIDIKNVNGEMTLFPSYIFHYTTPHHSDISRITIAFDLDCKQCTPNWIKL